MAITSPIAFQLLGDKTIAQSSLLVAQSFVEKNILRAHLAVAVTQEDAHIFSDTDIEVLVCNPNSPSSLATALSNSKPCEIVMIHDSQRPLTNLAQFEQVFLAIDADFDAVRPATAFTETLKVVNNDHSINRTIDRRSMLRISTPEAIRYSAIDFSGTSSTWFVPILATAKTSTIESDSQSLRVNSQAEIPLLQSFIKWQQSSSNN